MAAKREAGNAPPFMPAIIVDPLAGTPQFRQLYVSLDGLAGELRRLGLKMASNLLVDPALELSSQIKNL